VLPHTIDPKEEEKKNGFLFGFVICSSIVEWTAE
jgi:hypothetical protein